MSEPPPPPPPPSSSGGPVGEHVPTPPPRPTTRKGAPKKPKVKRRGVGSYVFVAVIAVVALVGVWQLYEAFTASDTPAVGDHIHAALGINVCGTFVENAPEFENRDGTQTKAGLHSHGDGLVHIHPFVEEEAKDEATLGRFFEYGGWEVDEDHLVLWDDLDVSSGGQCLDGRTANVRWSVNGEEQDGNPADYKPDDQDVVVIGFLPDGDPLGEPPAEVLAALPNPADVPQEG